MYKKYKVTQNTYAYDCHELNEGDIVIKIEGSKDNDLYELPKHLHGKGHNATVYDKHLNLQGRKYIYINDMYLEEIMELEK